MWLSGIWGPFFVHFCCTVVAPNPLEMRRNVSIFTRINRNCRDCFDYCCRPPFDYGHSHPYWKRRQSDCRIQHCLQRREVAVQYQAPSGLDWRPADCCGPDDFSSGKGRHNGCLNVFCRPFIHSLHRRSYPCQHLGEEEIQIMLTLVVR